MRQLYRNTFSSSHYLALLRNVGACVLRAVSKIQAGHQGNTELRDSDIAVSFY